MAEENDAKDPFEEARGLRKKYKYAEAVDAYKKALADLEQSGKSAPPEVYSDMGEAFEGLRRYREAIDCYQKAATQYDKQVCEARCKYANLTARQKSATENNDELKAKQEAHDELEKAEGDYVDTCNDMGSAYQSLGQYDEAIEQFRLAIKRGEKYPYAHHNLATVFQLQGRYHEAMTKFRDAEQRYRKLAGKAKEEKWVGHFLYFGNLLHEVFGDFAGAAEAYEAGLKVDGDHTGILTSQVALYLERRDECVKERNANSLAARSASEKAKNSLTKILSITDDFETLITMGELALTVEEYGKAEDPLTEAFSKNEAFDADVKKSARPATDLGVLCMRREEFKEAIQHFETAVEMEIYDLSMRSNLAEAYLKDKQLEEAEKQFQRVLQTAPDHVESRIGLARVYAAFGETGDPDMYDAAIDQYSKAITLAMRNTGSKRLKKKELAAVLYSRGYARVKFCEASKSKDRGLLYPARVDFSDSLEMDPELFKAKRAVDKIDKVLPRRTPQGLLEKWGPLVILGFSTFVFLLSQLGIVLSFMDKSKPPLLGALDQARYLHVNEYVALTFGSLLLMVASCYLPQLLKLKVPGIELEKTVVDQTTSVGTVGISKD